MDKKNILIIVLIFLTILGFILFFTEKNKNINSKSEINYTYLLSKPSETMDEELIDCKQILTFNENDECIDCRLLYEFKEEARAKEQYEAYKSMNNPVLKNISINGKIVTFTALNHNGKTKSEFLEGNENSYLQI